MTGMAHPRIGLLGPTQIDGIARLITEPQQLVIFAVLALRPGEPVLYDTLAEAIWGDGQEWPKNPHKQVQNRVGALAKVLAGHGLRITNVRGTGYQLEVGPFEVDVLIFEHKCRESDRLLRKMAWHETSVIAGEGERLWRWIPFHGIRSDTLDRKRSGLEKIRLDAQRNQIRADIHLGRHREVIPRLEKLTDAHPLDEDLCKLLMIALHRSGRKALALQAYDTLEQNLEKKYATEPFTGLQDLKRLIHQNHKILNDPTWLF